MVMLCTIVFLLIAEDHAKDMVLMKPLNEIECTFLGRALQNPLVPDTALDHTALGKRSHLHQGIGKPSCLATAQFNDISAIRWNHHCCPPATIFHADRPQQPRSALRSCQCYAECQTYVDARRVLTREEARAVYNRMGSKIVDSESPYGGPATKSLLESLQLQTVESVFEFGCGPGRLAQRVLETELPNDSQARYVACDQSPVMIGLASKRLQRHIASGRCEVIETNGDPSHPALQQLPSESFDLYLSTYVLDLLSEDDISAVLKEAWRLLRPGGRLAISGITYGDGFRNRCAVMLWELIHRVRPGIVGGCRHQKLLPYIEAQALDGRQWRVMKYERIPGSGSGVTSLLWSEVVVAIKDV
eukprot:gnl/TRDRNA2_/TRDRNA2_29688_c0_seq1.p1 gnl/TRDRNA2_/TRDRNA2_29688_c0~~gnl/TRDRNA2_/TRDRNA2_29688_c0_seq1.p1  ORF type:complete len:360 (-),score=30.13 gnl/TRDRNA2_/TRDRNA2_29688_c0_seq1:51-1130(-)